MSEDNIKKFPNKPTVAAIVTHLMENMNSIEDIIIAGTWETGEFFINWSTQYEKDLAHSAILIDRNLKEHINQ